MPISVDAAQVRDILDGDADDDYSIEVTMAEAIVNEDLAPHSDKTEKLELTGALIAAAYAKDDGDGPLSSVTQGTAQISWNNDGALTFWRRAKQMDPTGRLAQLEKPTVSITASDVRGGR